MPTFTAIALDRLIETDASKTMAREKYGSDKKLDRMNSTLTSMFDRKKLEEAVNVPNGKLDRGNSTSTITVDRKHHWIQISPALYATPEPTPLPDSPSSFPPSPYIINHKRRGPRLLKSFSEDDVAMRKQALEEKKLDENAEDAQKEAATVASDGSYLPEKIIKSRKEDNGASTNIHNPVNEKIVNGLSEEEIGINGLANVSAVESSTVESVTFSFQQDGVADDFFDPQESVSVKSYGESETNSVTEQSLNVATPVAEFYDAWEELSSGSAQQLSVPDIETEIREIRLSLLMEIERRKQAEESLKNTRAQWQKIREELSTVGLRLPADLVTVSEDEQLNNPIQELSRQFDIVRFVSNSIGKGTGKAEVEMEMEAQLELKNFEISRLSDRLHCYEAVNREMSRRNQETIETSRRLRQRRKRRRQWIWGSVAAAITLSASVLAWSYFPSGKASASTNLSHTPKGDHTSEQ